MPAISRPTTAAASTPFAASVRSPGFRREPATLPCSTRRQHRFPGDRRDRRDHGRPRHVPGRRRRRRFDGDLHGRRLAPRPGPGAAGRPALFRRRSARRRNRRRQAGRPGGDRTSRAGDLHGWTRVQATVRVNRAAATLPANVREILTRPRKAGEAEAAIDPLADPAVRKAVANATFEHLIGFQLTTDQLKYNATR